MTCAIRTLPLVLAIALATAACGPSVKHGVSQPPSLDPPPKEVRLDRPDVSSRESGEESDRLNLEWVAFTSGTLTEVLTGRDIEITTVAPYRVTTRVYIAYEKTLVRNEGDRRFEPGFAEVQIRLVRTDTGEVVYSTFSKSKIRPAPMADWFGGPDTGELVREIIRQAASEFASRL